jgi:hypothetical protein
MRDRTLLGRFGQPEDIASPLYGLYRTRDHLSALIITVVFAIFAGSTIAILQRDNSIAARIQPGSCSS